MRINNNLMALNTHRQLGLGQTAASKSMERLSSGYRINRAGDDAAGLAISEKMRGQIRGLTQASRNAQDGISLIQTAEGALSETHAILQRMRELAVQAANGTYQPEDATAIQEELTKLKEEITRIGEATEFNGKKLLNGSLGVTATGDAKVVAANGVTDIVVSGTTAGNYTITAVQNADNNADTDLTISFGGVSQTITVSDPATGTTSDVRFDQFGITLKINENLGAQRDTLTTGVITVSGSGIDLQIGANNSSEQKLQISISSMTANTLGVGGASAASGHAAWSVNDVDVSTNANARDSIDVIEKAITQVSAERSKLGAYQNRLEHTIKNLDTSAENLQASESRIRDVDMAKEMMEYTKNMILQQAAQAMLAQANQAPQGVLQLLQ